MNALIVATIAIGLPVDQHWARYGQVMVSAATWLVLAALWSKSDPRTRPALAACLLFATAGEVFLSLVWGLYDYRLIEASLDDLSALPDDHDVAVETAFPSGLHIVGEKRYTAIILQNLLENARKYNHRKGGRIRITASVEGAGVRLSVGNTGRPISPEGQAHIFERFHRGVMGENVPGYGLGLNLARELARLHQGDLRLIRSDELWTEFEVRFRLAHRVQPSSTP
jgi:signal transduction histidine kinase